MNQPIWKSSANPDNLSVAVKGLLWFLVPLVLSYGQSHGVNVPVGNNEAVDQLEQAFIAITALWAAAQVAFGAVRKIYYWFRPKTL